MSAILKALQKLEGESLKEGGGPLRPPKGKDRKSFWWVVIIVSSAAACFWIFGQDIPGLDRIFREGKTDLFPQRPSGHRKSTPRETKAEGVAPPPPATTVRGNPPIPENETKPLPEVRRPVFNREPVSPITREQPAKPVQPQMERLIHRPAGPPASATEEAPTELELQAVVWSKDPASRLAVINGQIVREGGTLGGLSISRIDAEEVILGRGEKKIKLKYPRK